MCVTDNFFCVYVRVCVCFVFVCVCEEAPALWHLVIFVQVYNLPMTPFTQNQTKRFRQNHLCKNLHLCHQYTLTFLLFHKFLKILALLTHLHVIPNLYGFLSFLNRTHKENILVALFSKMKVDNNSCTPNLLNTFNSFFSWGKDWNLDCYSLKSLTSMSSFEK